MALDIAVTAQGPSGRQVALRGRLDTLTTPELEGALTPILEAPAVTSVVFHAGALEYISSAGVRCLIRAQKALGARGGQVAIVNPQPAVRRVFEIVKAFPLDLIFATEADLAASRGTGLPPGGPPP